MILWGILFISSIALLDHLELYEEGITDKKDANFGWAIFSAFHIMIVDNIIEDLESWQYKVIFIVSTILLIIIMNLLISVISDTYDKVQMLHK